MVKVIIYKDYDLIEEIKKLIKKGEINKSYSDSYWILKEGLQDLKENIQEAAEVMIK